MSFRLVPKSVTLNDPERRITLRYFTADKILPRQLHGLRGIVPPRHISAPALYCILANVNVRSRIRYMSSSVRLSSVFCLSATFVRCTQAIKIFGNVLCLLVRWPSVDIQVKFYGDRPLGEPLRQGS